LAGRLSPSNRGEKDEHHTKRKSSYELKDLSDLAICGAEFEDFERGGSQQESVD
jgi:hypothetical protein